VSESFDLKITRKLVPQSLRSRLPGLFDAHMGKDSLLDRIRIVCANTDADDVESFEPLADGFRNYRCGNGRLSAEEQLIN
jgi:hypothetical protein